MRAQFRDEGTQELSGGDDGVYSIRMSLRYRDMQVWCELSHGSVIESHLNHFSGLTEALQEDSGKPGSASEQRADSAGF